MTSTDRSDAEIRPFRIEVPQPDLAERLARTWWANERPPEPAEGEVQTGSLPPVLAIDDGPWPAANCTDHERKTHHGLEA